MINDPPQISSTPSSSGKIPHADRYSGILEAGRRERPKGKPSPGTYPDRTLLRTILKKLGQDDLRGPGEFLGIAEEDCHGYQKILRQRVNLVSGDQTRDEFGRRVPVPSKRLVVGGFQFQNRPLPNGSNAAILVRFSKKAAT
jgi:hypothetical protein